MESIISMTFKKVYNSISDQYINSFYEELLNAVDDNDKKLLYQIARLDMFLDPSHFIGEYANVFRSRFVNERISPEMLVNMETTEFLPEVFHVTVDESILAEIEGEIRKHMKRIKGHEIKEKRNKKLEKMQKQLPDICDTAYWQISRPNTVIIKDDGYFYCIDIERMIVDSINNGYFTNYITGKKIEQETEMRIRKYYEKEIDMIRRGEKLSIPLVTDDERDDLTKTVEELKKLREYVMSHGEILIDKGSSVLERKKIFRVIPRLERENIKKIDDNQEMVKHVVEWLDENIDMITGVLKEKDDESEPVMPEEYEAPNKEERKTIEKYILVEGSVIENIVNNYRKRIHAIKRTIEERMKETQDKVELMRKMNEAEDAERYLDNQVSNIEGLKLFLKDRIEKLVEMMDTAMMMNASRILESDIMLSETTELKKVYNEYMNELERIQRIEIKRKV